MTQSNLDWWFGGSPVWRNPVWMSGHMVAQKKCNMQTVYAYIISVYIYKLHTFHTSYACLFLPITCRLPTYQPTLHHPQAKSQSSLPSLSSSTTTNLDDSTQAEVCLVVRQARGTMMLPVAAWGHDFFLCMWLSCILQRQRVRWIHLTLKHGDASGYGHLTTDPYLNNGCIKKTGMVNTPDIYPC